MQSAVQKILSASTAPEERSEPFRFRCYERHLVGRQTSLDDFPEALPSLLVMQSRLESWAEA